jgi:hypothetical protein
LGTTDRFVRSALDQVAKRTVKMSEDHSTNPQDNDRIAQRAYAIWMQEGCPEGQNEAHWQQAEAEMAGAKDYAASDAKGDPVSAGASDTDQGKTAQENEPSMTRRPAAGRRKTTKA